MTSTNHKMLFSQEGSGTVSHSRVSSMLQRLRLRVEGHFKKKAPTSSPSSPPKPSDITPDMPDAEDMPVDRNPAVFVDTPEDAPGAAVDATDLLE